MRTTIAFVGIFLLGALIGVLTKVPLVEKSMPEPEKVWEWRVQQSKSYEDGSWMDCGNGTVVINVRDEEDLNGIKEKVFNIMFNHILEEVVEKAKLQGK